MHLSPPPIPWLRLLQVRMQRGTGGPTPPPPPPPPGKSQVIWVSMENDRFLWNWPFDFCKIGWGLKKKKQKKNVVRAFFVRLTWTPPPPWRKFRVRARAVRSKAVVLFLLTFCLLLLPLWESVIVLCFVVRYFMSILVLQSSDGEERAGCFAYLSSWCLVMVEWLFLAVPWVVCGLWMWYFLIIFTYYF